ncbi:MAG: hypothetical protein IKL55_06445 [Clostridia bacterium]|nr:hypothetical protein [Clostridia bacterium]
MNRKILGKLLIILLLITIAVNNVSYAININKENFKKALMHIFASSIKILTESKTEGFSGSFSTTYNAPTEIKIEEDKILLKEIGEVDGETKEYTMEIDYAIENNMVEFSMESDVKEYLAVAGKDENPGLAMIGLVFLHNNSMTASYLAVADYLKIDLNTAATYFTQCANENTTKDPETSDEESDEYNETTICDLYTRNLYYNETNGLVKSSIKINITELEKVNSSLLDESVKTTIEFINEYKEPGSENDNENTNNTVNNSVNNSVNNTTNEVNNAVNNVVNNAVNNTTNKVDNKTVNNIENNTTNKTVNKNITNNSNSKPADNTTSNKIIPAAGSETVYYILISLVVISLLIYVKLRKYDDVK